MRVPSTLDIPVPVAPDDAVEPQPSRQIAQARDEGQRDQQHQEEQHGVRGHHVASRRRGVRRDLVEGGVGRQPPRAWVAQVIVPDYQLSLAIGKEGQNVRLAARLTGWRIDIQPDTQPGPALGQSVAGAADAPAL